MTLDKHPISGVRSFGRKTVASIVFEKAMISAGYEKTGSIVTWQGRVKVWWEHKTYNRVESIYSPDKRVVITAYHVDN
jgi:hypothetical protein